MNGLVSVIIPSFNSSQYLKESIDSVLSQTYKKFEIVVVDDGSTDDVEEVVAPYISSGAIHFLKKENGGPAPARNLGIRNSSGELIAFLDADDVWKQDKLEEQLPLFSDEKIALVYSDMEFFGAPFRFSRYSDMAGGFYEGDVLYNLLKGNFIPNSSVVVRRKILEEVGLYNEDPELFAVEDYDLWIKVATKYKIGFSPESLVKYRVHENQISRTKKRTYKALCRMYEKLLRDASFDMYKDLIRSKMLENRIKYFLSF